MLPDIVSNLRGRFAPGAHSELRAQRSTSRRVTLLSGNLVKNARAESQGVSARVYDDGVYGFASAADVSPEAARKALQTAGDNARFLRERVSPGKGPLPPIASPPRRRPRCGAPSTRARRAPCWRRSWRPAHSR